MLFAVCKDDDNRASMKVRKLKQKICNVEHILNVHLTLQVFFEEIQRTGVRAKTDPRLKQVIKKLEKYRPKPGAALESIT